MKKQSQEYIVTSEVKSRLLAVARDYDTFLLLDNSFSYGDDSAEKPFEGVAALGCVKSVSIFDKKEVDKFLAEAKQDNNWVFAHIGYSVKDKIEKITSRSKDCFGWSELQLFVPETCVIYSQENMIIETFNGNGTDYIYQQLQKSKELLPLVKPIVTIIPSLSFAGYAEKIKRIKQHIQRGDIYEMNFCMEMKAENAEIDPYAVFLQLSQSSPAPFACFYKSGKNYLLCSSPERFINKKNSSVISQPIKGTAKRGLTSEEDEQLKKQLYNSEKERSENVMIVDLVRNDLSRIAIKGSVKVTELFGIYSFPVVHQMISTIACEVEDTVTFSEIIAALFPMGSMTGAPKVSAMKLIDQFENFNRGIYSGSVGYIKPDGDFDFNVVIRSIIYNQEKKMLTVPVGSAITATSDADKEYHECLLKAKGLLQVLGMELNKELANE